MRIKIEPLVSFLGTAKVLEILSVQAVLSTSATFAFRLLDGDDIALHHGQIHMPPPDYAMWGDDDLFAARYVAGKVGATIVSIDEPYRGNSQSAGQTAGTVSTPSP